ncbi:MAG: ATP-binding protein [Pseudomonadota bacterium]
MALPLNNQDQCAPVQPDGPQPMDAPPNGGSRFRRSRRRAKPMGKEQKSQPLWPAVTVLVLGVGVLLLTSLAPQLSLGGIPALLPLLGAILCTFGGVWLKRLVHRQHAQQTARNLALSQRLESLDDQVWEIRESEEIHRTLTEGFGDVVLHRDDTGTITFTNSIYALYFNADYPAPDLNASAETNKVEMKLATRQGERWFSWTQSPVRNSETGRSGFQAVGRDITDRRQGEAEREQALEMAREAGSARARFLATMSHEMRTPLNGILGMNRLLAETSLSATQRDYCRAIGESGQVLLTLIDDVLDTALVNEGKITLAPAHVPLLPLVESVGELLAARQGETALPTASPAHTAQPLPVGIFVDTACPKNLHVDEKRLRQILMNLVGNALKFTQTGGVGLFVERVDEGLRFCVRDSGPGMDEAEQERLFEPFEQANQGITRRHGGAGLGLSIARHLVALMGGELMVHSPNAKGCAFFFTLPLDASTHPVQQAQGPKSGPPVALAMERSPARDALVKSIIQQGHACHCFSSTDLLMAATKAEQWPPTAEQKTGQNPKLENVPQPGFIVLSQGNGKKAHQLRSHFDDCGLTAMQYLSLSPAGRRQINGDTPLASADRQAVFDGLLTWPVRQSSLRRVLRRSLSGAQRPKVAAPPLAPLLNSASTVQNVLLAEDNGINALLARSLLSKLGYTVTTVADGKQALAAFESKDFKLVLLDLHMPHLDGLETVKALRTRENDQGLPPVPVFILSADNQPTARQAALASGATDFLLKPLDFDAVRSRLQAHTPMQSKGPKSPSGEVKRQGV